MQTSTYNTEEGSLHGITPLFDHDCDCCTYLGRSSNDDHDLYFCPQADENGNSPFGVTLIARFSSHGPDYKSGLVFKDRIPEIGQAYVLARQKGLIK